MKQPICLSTRYKVPYHFIKSKLIISGGPSEALGVSYSLYYSWLDTTQDWSEEAPGGNDGSESDLMCVNLNSAMF